MRQIIIAFLDKNRLWRHGHLGKAQVLDAAVYIDELAEAGQICHVGDNHFSGTEGGRLCRYVLNGIPRNIRQGGGGVLLLTLLDEHAVIIVQCRRADIGVGHLQAVQDGESRSKNRTMKMKKDENAGKGA
jgi:hypothetical protein